MQCAGDDGVLWKGRRRSGLERRRKERERPRAEVKLKEEASVLASYQTLHLDPYVDGESESERASALGMRLFPVCLESLGLD